MSVFFEDRFAVIADIHSNVDALAAVLQDISDCDLKCIVNLGDHVSGPMAPKETADMLMAADIINVRGNHDRWVCAGSSNEMSSIDKVARDDLGQNHLAWLMEMPATIQLSKDVFACHGTPESDLEYWLEDVQSNGAVVLRSQTEIAKHTAASDANLFLCGHTHLPRRVDLPNGKTVLNPGSVGCPAYMDSAPYDHKIETGTPTACYAIVERREHGWVTMFRHVPYDPSRMIAQAIASDHPHWEVRLATGRAA
jgi:predicted phosphodiesterase